MQKKRISMDSEKRGSGKLKGIKTIFEQKMEDPEFKAIYDKISKEIDADEEKAKKRMMNKRKDR